MRATQRPNASSSASVLSDLRVADDHGLAATERQARERALVGHRLAQAQYVAQRITRVVVGEESNASPCHVSSRVVDGDDGPEPGRLVAEIADLLVLTEFRMFEQAHGFPLFPAIQSRRHPLTVRARRSSRDIETQTVSTPVESFLYQKNFVNIETRARDCAHCARCRHRRLLARQPLWCRGNRCRRMSRKEGSLVESLSPRRFAQAPAGVARTTAGATHGNGHR